MSMTEFRVGAARTINLGNFESVRIEATVVTSIPEGDDLEMIKTRAQTELRQLMEDTYRNVMKPKPKPEDRP